MAQIESQVLVLSDDQRRPEDLKTPPRQPKWTDTFAYIANPDRFCRENLQKYGPIFKTSVFGGTTVFVGSAEANHMVFNGDGQYTDIGLPSTTMAMFGEHSLFQRPDLHRARKSAIRPAFAGSMLAGYLPRMHQKVNEGIGQWDASQPLPLFSAVETITFETLVPLLLGIDLSRGNEVFSESPIESQTALKKLYEDFFNGFYGLLKWRSPLTAFGRGQRARQKLIEFMRVMIQRRRQSAIDPSADFLSMMLASQQENPEGVFDDDLIENQCLLQLWASHYEISGVISSWMYQMGQHPHCFQIVLDEVQSLLDHTSDLSTVGLDKLRNLKELDASIKETLRTLTPTSTANRRLTQSIAFQNFHLQKGWGLVAESRISHIIPEYFENPEVFDPSRFHRGEGENYKFIPFGGGVHACLGAQMAMVMTKIFALHLLKDYRFELLGKGAFVQFPLKYLKKNFQVRLLPMEKP